MTVEHTKITYAGSLLADKALKWYRSKVNSSGNSLFYFSDWT